MASEEEVREAYQSMSKEVLLECAMELQYLQAEQQYTLGILIDSVNEANVIIRNMVGDCERIAETLTNPAEGAEEQARLEAAEALASAATVLDHFLVVKMFQFELDFGEAE